MSLLDCGQILNYSDYMVDLTQVEDTSFWSHVLSGTGFFQKEGDSAVYGIPASYQGFGLLYNKTIVKKVFGEDFDVNTVNTVDKLVKFFDDIEAAGYASTVVFSADWALGAHYLGCQLCSEWLGDKATQRQLMADLKDGKKILGHVLGDDQNELVGQISRASGVTKGTTATILALAAPLLLSLMGSQNSGSSMRMGCGFSAGISIFSPSCAAMAPLRRIISSVSM